MSYRSVFRPDLFAGQVVIVTGGGSGIGRCTAHELASLGAHVVLIGRKIEKLEQTSAEIAGDGGSVDFHTCDIREEERVREVVTAILATHGRIHGLINNAGGQFAALMHQISQKGFETVVRNNLTGGFLMSREVYTQCMEKHGGAIVNMLADFWKGMPTMGHSGAARAGMENLTKTLAVEWGHSGVRVNAVAPGWIASSGLDKYDDETKKNIRKLKNWLPLKRLGLEDEVSAAMVFLLSEAAAFITGDTIQIDGGAPLAPLHWEMPEHDRSRPYQGFHRGQLPQVLEGS